MLLLCACVYVSAFVRVYVLIEKREENEREGDGEGKAGEGGGETASEVSNDHPILQSSFTRVFRGLCCFSRIGLPTRQYLCRDECCRGLSGLFVHTLLALFFFSFLLAGRAGEGGRLVFS